MVERIPEKTAALVLSGTDKRVSADGYEVTVYAENADIYVKTHESVSIEEAFIVKQGSTLRVSGDIVLYAADAKARLLYCRLL